MRASRRRRTLLSDRAGRQGGFWDRLNGLNFNRIGYIVVALSITTWAIALTVWRFGRIEEHWTVRLQTRRQAA